MDNISIDIFNYFNDLLNSYDLCTNLFITSYSDEAYSYIKEHEDNSITLEFDITMDDIDNMQKYILKIPELHQKGVFCDFEDYDNKYEYEEGKRKYILDLTISKYFIRNFKLKKLLL